MAAMVGTWGNLGVTTYFSALATHKDRQRGLGLSIQEAALKQSVWGWLLWDVRLGGTLTH